MARRLVCVKEGSPEEQMALDYVRNMIVSINGMFTLPGLATSNAVLWWEQE